MFTVHEEQETHFVVSRDGGAPFAVVKHGLLPDTITRVRAMLPQKMAAGGTVRGVHFDTPELDPRIYQAVAEGSVDPTGLPTAESMRRSGGYPLRDPGYTPKSISGPDDIAQPQSTPGPTATAIPEGTYVDAQGNVVPKVDLIKWFTTPTGPVPQQEEWSKPKTGLLEPSPGSEAQAPLPPQLTRPEDLAQPQSVPPQHSAQPQPAQGQGQTAGTLAAASPEQARDKLMAGFERGSESPAERSQREAEADIEKKGQIQQSGFEQQQTELQRQEAERQKLVSDLQVQRKANDDALTEWAKKEPDQGRWWSSKSTGNKIGSGIAMILGGFFSGISGQKNQALQVIEDSIAKDVQSQVDQKNSMVHRLMENGRSINEAFQLAHAGLLEATANRMEQIRAGMAAQSVGPDTDLAIKGLRAQAEQIKQSAALKGLEAQKTASEIAKNQAEATKLYAEAGKAGREGRGAVYGQRIGSEQLGQLSKEERTRFVHVGDGQWMPAASEEQAKLATGQLESGRNLSRSINALDAYLKKGTLVKGTEDYAGAKAAANAMMGPMRSILGLGVLSEADKDLVSSLVAHPEELFTLGSTSRGRLRELRRMANQSFANAYDRLGVTVPETTAR